MKTMCSLFRSVPRSGPAFVVLLALSIGAGACSPAGPTHEFRVFVEDGVEVALTTGGPKYDGEIFEYELMTTVMPDPEIEESFLFSPQWMTLSEDGRIFVGDMGDEQVVVFSPDGDYLYRIGREGQGPGEIQQLGFVSIVDDVLWVSDLFGRQHGFELDGTYVETVSLPQSARSLMRDGRFWRLDDGRFVIFTLQRRSDRYSEATAEMHVVGPDGEPVASITAPWVRTGEYLPAVDGGRREYRPYHFAGRPWGDFSPSFGFFLTNPPRPEVLVYDDQGSLQRRYRVDMPAQPVTDEDRDGVRELLRQQLELAEAGRLGSAVEGDLEAERRALADLRFAEVKSPWDRPIIDDKGFLWVSIPEPRAYTRPAYRLAVFSPEGEYLGITTPPGWPQPIRGKLLTRWEDPETGEEYPAVYNVVPAVGGLAY